MGPLGRQAKKRFFSGDDKDPSKKYFTMILLTGAGAVVLMVLIALVTFVLFMSAGEQTLVPDVTGLRLPDALVKLQEKALYAEVHLLFSENQEDKDFIMGQQPVPGSQVKAGARVTLSVSKGTTIEKLGAYVGWTIDDFENHLSSMSRIYGSLLEVQYPITRVHSDAPFGQIIAQNPPEGTPLTEKTMLTLTVSKGQVGAMIEIYDYMGLPFETALKSMLRYEIPFSFSSRAKGSSEAGGYIVNQIPEAGEFVAVNKRLMQFTIAAPDDLEKGMHFGIIDEILPSSPVKKTLVIERIKPLDKDSDDDAQPVVETLYTTRHAGGNITIPYVEKKGTLYIFKIEDQEVYRFTVGQEEL